ncbi:MAG: 3-dehydroquinate synthase [Cellvibrionaceae bacterium]|jgi:3-dehydroquinate synthase
MNVQALTVELKGDRSYPIFIGKGLLSDRKYFSPYINGKQVCVVTNETIAPLYLSALIDLLSLDYQVDTVVLPDGEQYKTQDTVMKIYDCLLEKKHNRSTTLIALGGGVVGDMTGFAAASYQRGVNFIQVPTTLLSQVDSSVGGKTGVNHPLGKNMIGAFHQPQAVIIDIDVLNTLPKRELSAGVAEVVKYGLINDSGFYQWLEDSIGALLVLDETVLAETIFRSCQNKADVVSQDEKENGIRAILNLGHTFGHAIESSQGYGVWLHGEAVAIGMVLALELSSQLGWIEGREVDRLSRLLMLAGLPVIVPMGMADNHFLELMAVDKKVIDGSLRLVLLEKIGCAIVTSEVTQDQIISSIRAHRAS